MDKFVILIGDEEEVFSTVGPFSDRFVAEMWGLNNIEGYCWRIVVLHPYAFDIEFESLDKCHGVRWN